MRNVNTAFAQCLAISARPPRRGHAYAAKSNFLGMKCAFPSGSSCPVCSLRTYLSWKPVLTSTFLQSITSTYALLGPQETADRLHTSLSTGLSPSDAEARLIKDGRNELPHEEPEPLWLRFLK